MEAILDTWPWYVSGPLIAFTMATLILFGKRFGMSSNLETFCTLMGAGKVAKLFKVDWREQGWNLMVVLGVLIGGFVARNYMVKDEAVQIADTTVLKLKELGFDSAGKAYMPKELFDVSAMANSKVVALLVLGGFLVGFGARYAGGCTSGHAISGLSNLQFPSLLAVIGFFGGGLVMVHFIFPLIF